MLFRSKSAQTWKTAAFAAIALAQKYISQGDTQDASSQIAIAQTDEVNALAAIRLHKADWATAVQDYALAFATWKQLGAKKCGSVPTPMASVTEPPLPSPVPLSIPTLRPPPNRP